MSGGSRLRIQRRGEAVNGAGRAGVLLGQLPRSAPELLSLERDGGLGSGELHGEGIPLAHHVGEGDEHVTVHEDSGDGSDECVNVAGADGRAKRRR